MPDWFNVERTSLKLFGFSYYPTSSITHVCVLSLSVSLVYSYMHVCGSVLIWGLGMYKEIQEEIYSFSQLTSIPRFLGFWYFVAVILCRIAKNTNYSRMCFFRPVALEKSRPSAAWPCWLVYSRCGMFQVGKIAHLQTFLLPTEIDLKSVFIHLHFLRSEFQ